MQKTHTYIIILLSLVIVGFGYLLDLGVFVVVGFVGLVIGLLIHQFGIKEHREENTVLGLIDSAVSALHKLF